MARAGRNSRRQCGIIKETINLLGKRFTMANASCLRRLRSISADFIFIEMVFSFGYLELIMPRLAITWGSAPSSVPVKLHTHLCTFVKWNGCCVQIAFGAFHTNVPSACAHLSWILRYPAKVGKRERNLMQKIRRERKEEKGAQKLEGTPGVRWQRVIPPR